MTTYNFSGAVAYDRLGSSWRTAAGLRSVSVKDPATGLLPANLKQAGVAVSWLTADSNSRYSFTCDVPGVVVDFGTGSQTLYANEVPLLSVANAAAAQAAAASAAASAALVGAPADTAIATVVGNTTSATRTAMRGSHGFLVVDYLPSGVTMASATDAQSHAAFAAACAAAGPGMVILPPSELRVVGSFSMAGYSCSLSGGGSSMTSGYTGTGSVIRAVAQTGPVLDFNGYLYPYDFIARPIFQDFMIVGDGTSGSAKRGMYFPHSDLTSDPYPVIGAIRNIGIQKTGGTGLEMKDAYLGLVDNVLVSTPVGCVANNVPYAKFIGCNGMTIRMGFRSTVFGDLDQDTPNDGVLRLVGSTLATGFPFHRAVVSCWFENLHLGTGKTCVVAQTNAVVYENFLYFDIKKVTGATDTSYFRFELHPTLAGSGGNIYRGIVEGDFNGAATAPDFGIDVFQGWNRIEGIKGYRGNNVRLNAGVGNTFVSLGGRAGNASTPSVVDNSGVTTNVLSGAWSSYGPVLTATANPTLGTGSSVSGSKYTVSPNSVVTCVFDILFGTSSAAAGSGTYVISIPVPAVVNTVPLGVVWVTANGLTTACVAILNGTSAIRLQYLTAAVNGTPTFVGAAAPGVFTNNDEIRGTITYQAALI